MPSATVATQLASILGLSAAPGVVRGNHLDAESSQFRVQRVAVIGLVTDKAFGKWPHEASLQRVGDVSRFMSLTACNPHGDRKAIAVCHCHEFGRLAASSDPNKRTPLFAPAWEPSMKASVRSIFPLCRRSSASSRRAFGRTPSLTQRWNRRWQVWYGGYRPGKSAHGAPVRRIHSTPFTTSRGSRQGRPPLAPVLLRSGPGKEARMASHCSSVRSITTVDHGWRSAVDPLQNPIEFRELTPRRL